jgi:hypothetical protein
VTRNLVVAIALSGVVAGHWLTTTLVDTPTGMLVGTPFPHRWTDLVPAALVLLVVVAADAVPVRRLVVQTAVLLGCWAAVLFGLVLRGVDQDTAHNIGVLVVEPLWFVGAYLVVAVLKPLLHKRFQRGNWVSENALAILLVHQSALVTVTLVFSAWGPLPGLQRSPADPGWLWHRLLWLPVFAAVTWGWLRALRARSPRRAAPRPAVPAATPASAAHTPAP